MERTRKVAARDCASAKDIYQAICLDAAENLDANLVSIWRFDENCSKIICLHALDVESGTASAGQELMRDDFPRYFESILEETTISAPDARTHPMTRELTEAYFVPNEIISLLDFIMHSNLKPVGVICCESKRKRRNWSEEDRQYILSLAAYASFQAVV